MQIRTTEQVANLAVTDFIRWRAGLVSDMAIMLAQNFSEQDLNLALEGRHAMRIVRAGHHPNEMTYLAQDAPNSINANIVYLMAELLKQHFNVTELRYMDGLYDEIFQKAVEYTDSIS